SRDADDLHRGELGELHSLVTLERPVLRDAAEDRSDLRLEHAQRRLDVVDLGAGVRAGAPVEARSRRDLPRRPIAWRPRSVDPVLRDSRAATLPYTPPTQVDDGRDVPLLHDRVARPTRHPRYQDAGRAGR